MENLNAEQVKKALECCAEDTPYPDQRQALLEALALINSQEQRIKELTEKNEKIGIENFDLICELSRIKEDTVRKMQERLHARKVSYGNITFRVVPIDDIDQIAKEMLEDAERRI